MTKKELEQARSFIFADIGRELHLAKATESWWKKVLLRIAGINLGGGNFLVAAGLMAYIEFAGKLKYGGSIASGNFNSFWDDLGKYYNDFRSSVNVYDVFRCGLVHEYYAKDYCKICMFGDEKNQGIGKMKSGGYYIIVENLFEDFRKAFDEFVDSYK